MFMSYTVHVATDYRYCYPYSFPEAFLDEVLLWFTILIEAQPSKNDYGLLVFGIAEFKQPVSQTLLYMSNNSACILHPIKA